MDGRDAAATGCIDLPSQVATGPQNCPFYHNLCTEGAPTPTEARGTQGFKALLEHKQHAMVDSANLKIDRLCTRKAREFADLEVKCNEILRHIVLEFS